jgi:hypothetical protein
MLKLAYEVHILVVVSLAEVVLKQVRFAAVVQQIEVVEQGEVGVKLV